LSTQAKIENALSAEINAWKAQRTQHYATERIKIDGVTKLKNKIEEKIADLSLFLSTRLFTDALKRELGETEAQLRAQHTNNCNKAKDEFAQQLQAFRTSQKQQFDDETAKIRKEFVWYLIDALSMGL
jgi:hypothetical protein